MEPHYAQHHPPGGSFPHYNPSPQFNQYAYTEDALAVPFGRSRNLLEVYLNPRSSTSTNGGTVSYTNIPGRHQVESCGRGGS